MAAGVNVPSGAKRHRLPESLSRKRVFLTHDAHVETRRKKSLRPNRLAPWELRIDDYRVFYDLEEDNEVKIVVVGHKEHNDLYIRGKKVEL